jgi:5-methylthioadenosine/S-adenosylhomocysteine deaminase
MFEIMRLTSYMHHGTWGLYYYDPLVLTAEEILEMVTINAARANLIEKETGSIEVGKKADITIVDFKRPHLTPSYDVIAELTRFTYGSDVDTVIVDGRVVMEDRVVKTLDEAVIIEKAQKIGLSTYEKTKSAISKTVPVNRWETL